MPTLAQVLNAKRPIVAEDSYLATITSATAATVTTDVGDLPNATGVTPTTGLAVVIHVAGQDIAVGWIRP